MARPHFDPRRHREPETRINMRIRADPIRVIGADGSMLGVMSNRDALRIAQEQNLDLVEVNPKAEPPVCKIMDFGKYKYEEKKKAREAKRKQTTVELKEVKLRPKTDDHDLNFKLRAARRFVEAGNKVKFVVRFRGREIAHPDRAQAQLVWLFEHLEDIANQDARPAMEGRTMTMLVSPKPAVLQRLSQLKAAAEAARRKAEAEGRVYEEEEPEEEPDLDDDLDDDDDDDDDEDDDEDGDEDGDEDSDE